MKKDEKKEKKEKKIPLGRTLYCNFLMLSKIWHMTPQYIVFMVIVGLVGGAANSVSTIFTYMLFNALDEPDVTFGKMASYVALILGVNLSQFLQSIGGIAFSFAPHLHIGGRRENLGACPRVPFPGDVRRQGMGRKNFGREIRPAL